MTTGAIVATIGSGLLVALFGNLMLDLIRGVPQRIEGRLQRLLQEIAEEEVRERWWEELQGVLLESQGRPLKQFRAGREVIRAAERLVELYGRAEEGVEAPATAVGPEQDEPDLSPASQWIDLRREFYVAASEFLSYRELRVLELRHGLSGGPRESAEAVGRRFNVVPEVIDRIEREAFGKLGTVAEAQKLRANAPARALMTPRSIGRDD